MPSTHFPGALSLPYELTSQIFLECLPRHRRIRPRPNRAPLQLASVCTQWRDVALATAELWTSLFLELPRVKSGDTTYSTDAHAEIAQSWLTRSAPLPVSITVVQRGTPSRLSSELFSIIASRSARWRRLELRIHGDDIAKFASLPGPFPGLISLALEAMNVPYFLIDLRSAIRQAPKLTALDISGTPESFDPEDLPPSLTSLQIRRADLSWTESCAILAHLPALRHFGCNANYYWLDLQTQPPEPRELPLLESLVLSEYHEVLDFMNLPNLRYLALETSQAVQNARILPFLSRSGCELRHLSFRIDQKTKTSAILPILLTTPSLLTLEIEVVSLYRSRPFDPDRFAFLQVEGSISHLQNLLITDASGDTLPAITSFLAVLFARSGLARAELHLRPDPRLGKDDEDGAGPRAWDLLQQLNELKAHGMDVRITEHDFSATDENDAPYDLGMQ